MRSNIAIAAAGGCALALLFGAVELEHQSACRADAAVSALAKKQAVLDSAVRQTEGHIAAARLDRGRLPAAWDMQWTRSAPLPAAVAGSPLADSAQLAVVDPKFAALSAKAFRANLTEQFASFYRALKLTPDQILKFEDLIAGNHGKMMDPQSDDPLRAAEIALLGEPGYRQLQEFNRAEPAREIVDHVAFAVGLSPSPLSASQVDSLWPILAHSSTRFQNGGRADLETINWDAALAEAQGVLSVPQLAALKAQHETIQVAQMRTQFNCEEAAAK